MSVGRWLFVVGGLFTIVTLIGAANSVEELPAADSYLHFWLRIPSAYWEIYFGFLAMALVMISMNYFLETKGQTRSERRLYRTLGLIGLFSLYLIPVLKMALETELGVRDSRFLDLLWDEFAFLYICSIILTMIAVPSLLLKAK